MNHWIKSLGSKEWSGEDDTCVRMRTMYVNGHCLRRRWGSTHLRKPCMSWMQWAMVRALSKGLRNHFPRRRKPLAALLCLWDGSSSNFFSSISSSLLFSLRKLLINCLFILVYLISTFSFPCCNQIWAFYILRTSIYFYYYYTHANITFK